MNSVGAKQEVNMGKLIRNHYVKNIAIFCLLGPLVGGILFSISVGTLLMWGYGLSLDAPNLKLIGLVTGLGYDKVYFVRGAYQLIPAALLTGFSASLLPQERNFYYIILVSLVGMMSSAFIANVVISEQFTALPALYGFVASFVCALVAYPKDTVPSQDESNLEFMMFSDRKM